MSYINLARRELSRPPEAEFPSLLQLTITRQRNPYATFVCYRLEGDSMSLLTGAVSSRRIVSSVLNSLMAVNRMIAAMRLKHAWSLDIKLAQLLTAGPFMPEFGAPAHVEIHVATSNTEWPDDGSFTYELKTYLRITYT